MKKTQTIIALLFAANTFAQTVDHSPYCTPANMGHIAGITNVKFGDIDNTTGLTDHVFYNNLPSVFYRDSTYTFSVTFDSNNYSFCNVGINYNRVFGGACLYSSEISVGANKFDTSFLVPRPTTSTVTYTFDITIPAAAPLDTARLRVYRYGGISIQRRKYCLCTSPEFDNVTFGEAEDYMLIIRDKPISLSVGEISKNFAIYPNPTNGIVNVPFGSKTTITDVLGKVVYSGNDTQINLTGLASGIYIAYINNVPYRIRKY